MQVKSIAECSKGISLPFVIKIFDLCIFEWPYYKGFTVHMHSICSRTMTYGFNSNTTELLSSPQIKSMHACSMINGSTDKLTR